MKGLSTSRLIVYGVFLLIAGIYAFRDFVPDRSEDVGKPVPGFEATMDNGEVLDLREAPGQVVVLTFWASWCTPCRQEAPILNALQDRALVVGVSLDDADPEGAVKLARGIGIEYRVIGGRQELAKRFGLDSVPTTYVIAADGTVIFARAGVASAEELQNAVQEATREI